MTYSSQRCRRIRREAHLHTQKTTTEYTGLEAHPVRSMYGKPRNTRPKTEQTSINELLSFLAGS